MSELTPRQKAAADRIANREKLRAGMGLPPETADDSIPDGGVFMEKIKDTPILAPHPLSAVDHAETKLLALEARHTELVDQIAAKEAEFGGFQTRMEKIAEEFERQRAEKEAELLELVRKNQALLDEVDRKSATRLTDEPAHPYNSSPEDLLRQFIGSAEGIAVTDPRVPRDTGALMAVLDDNAKRSFLAGVKAGRAHGPA